VTSGSEKALREVSDSLLDDLDLLVLADGHHDTALPAEQGQRDLAHGIEDAIEIASLADLPAGTGLGSSSCYLVGLLNAVRAYLSKPSQPADLADEACTIELDILRKPIGKQDQYIAAAGGLKLPFTSKVSGIAELRGLLVGGAVRMGAGVTFTTMLERDCGSVALREAARTVGSPQIRNAATIGGNVATSSPAGDALPVLAALDARVHLRSKRGTRVVAFADFMTGPKKNVRAPDELVSEVEWADAGPSYHGARATGGECRCFDCRTRSMDASEAGLAHDLRLLIRKGRLAGDSDRQAIGNGITTVFHATTWSWEPGLRSAASWRAVLDGLDATRAIAQGLAPGPLAPIRLSAPASIACRIRFAFVSMWMI